MAFAILSKKSALLAALLCVAALAPAAAADNLRRCEDAGGHVTYSNESCPSGTAHERSVENRPAVEVPRDGAGDRATAGLNGGSLVPSGHRADSHSPETAHEMDQEQRKALVSKCDDLVRRIEYGQQDLLSAAPGERASVELGMRRLQEEHETLCTPPKPRP